MALEGGVLAPGQCGSAEEDNGEAHHLSAGIHVTIRAELRRHPIQDRQSYKTNSSNTIARRKLQPPAAGHSDCDTHNS